MSDSRIHENSDDVKIDYLKDIRDRLTIISAQMERLIDEMNRIYHDRLDG